MTSVSTDRREDGLGKAPRRYEARTRGGDAHQRPIAALRCRPRQLPNHLCVGDSGSRRQLSRAWGAGEQGKGTCRSPARTPADGRGGRWRGRLRERRR
jgi:hypothetical protein